jgi:hypothetical protein
MSLPWLAALAANEKTVAADRAINFFNMRFPSVGKTLRESKQTQFELTSMHHALPSSFCNLLVFDDPD